MGDRIVLGLGGTVDYEVAWDSAVVDRLVVEFGIRADEVDCGVPIDSERNLLRCLLAFVRDGVGGERFVTSSAIVESFACRFPRRITLGGTCTRAALAMHKLGVPSTLHLVSIDDHVRQLLPAGCSYLCSATADSTDPHLIVQWRAGTRVRVGKVNFGSPHANRVILANDPPHEQMRLSHELEPLLADARVVLLSGLNAIRDSTVMEQRLTELVALLKGVSPDCLVHYEDAGFHVPSLSAAVNRRLGPLVGVHSMNEDELQSYLGRSCDLLDAQAVATALVDVQRLLNTATIVVHTKYWSLAAGAYPDRFTSALRGGITMASTRYLFGDDFTADDYAQVALISPNPAAQTFSDALERRLAGRVRCIPAMVLETPTPTTVGLGDSFVGGFLAAWRP